MRYNPSGFYCKKCNRYVHEDDIDNGCPYCGCTKFYELSTRDELVEDSYEEDEEEEEE